MGYQESIMFCKNKSDLKNLCRVLNYAKSDMEDYVEVYAVGKIKNDEKAYCCFCDDYHCIPKNSYFVWWGGERHPYQSGNALTEYMLLGFGENYTEWYLSYCENIYNINHFLKNIDIENKGELQENKHLYIIELDSSQPIRKDVIAKL